MTKYRSFHTEKSKEIKMSGAEKNAGLVAIVEDYYR